MAGKTKKVTKNEIVDRCIEVARHSGWSVEVGGKNIKFRAPDPQVNVIVTSKTPGDWRGPKNLRSLLRRGGLTV